MSLGKDIRSSLKQIRRYWEEFSADFIPEDTSPIALNLLKLAFFWGAYMAIDYQNSLITSPISPRDRWLVLSRFRGEVDDTINELHTERRILMGRGPLTARVHGASLSE